MQPTAKSIRVKWIFITGAKLFVSYSDTDEGDWWQQGCRMNFPTKTCDREQDTCWPVEKTQKCILKKRNDIHTLLPLQFTQVQVTFFCSYNCIYCPLLFIYFCLIGHTLHLSCFFFTLALVELIFLCTHNFALPVTTLVSIVYWLCNSTRILILNFSLCAFYLFKESRGKSEKLHCKVQVGRWERLTSGGNERSQPIRSWRMMASVWLHFLAIYNRTTTLSTTARVMVSLSAKCLSSLSGAPNWPKILLTARKMWRHLVVKPNSQVSLYDSGLRHLDHVMMKQRFFISHNT